VRNLLVLWDVDYTLVDAAGLGTRLYQAVFREMFGGDLPGTAPKAGRTDRAITLDTLALAGIDSPADHVDAFLALLATHVAAIDDTALDDTALDGPALDDTALRVRALPGAVAAITALAAADARQSVLTGNIRPLAELKLRAAGLGAPLDLDAGAYGAAHMDRADLVGVARRAAKAAYGVSFDGPAAVLVGDTPLDVAAALAAGARAVGVATGSYSPASLAAAGAHAVLPDLTDTAALLSAVTDR
jgi:phosphoglycolate phosphatase